MLDPTKRFTQRVDHYVAARPSYPAAIVDFLRETCGLTPDSTIADIGSGTGISAALFLTQGFRVIGVEPNAEMRTAAERLLAVHANFKSVDGTAERTLLADRSVDMIIAAQAFHWFRRAEAKVEFLRVLCRGGYVALIWNDRRSAATPFLRAFEEFLSRFSLDYERVKHQYRHEQAQRDFLGRDFRMAQFPNEQVLDWEGLRRRVLSASYMPAEAHPSYSAMIAALQALFDRYQDRGQVTIDYDTRVYCGRLDD